LLRLLLIFLPIFIYGNNIVSAGFQNNQFIVEFKRDLIQDEVSDLKQWKKIWFIDVKNSLFKDGFKKYFKKDIQVRITSIKSNLSRISFNTGKVEYEIQENKIILIFQDLNTSQKKINNLKLNKINKIISAKFENYNEFVVKFERDLLQDDVSNLKQWKNWYLDIKNSFFRDGLKKYLQKNIQVQITRIKSDLSRISFNTNKIDYKIQGNKIILIFQDLDTIQKKNIPQKKTNNLKHNKINKIISAKFESYNEFVVKFERDLLQDDVSNLKQWKNWYLDIKNSFFRDGLKQFKKKNVQIRITRIKSDLSRISFNTGKVEYKIQENKLIFKFKDLYKYVIVIDPGHGGKDSGSICRKYGTMEKRIVFSIAQYTKKELEKMGFKVLLTREKDVFIELIDRTRFANKHNADIFVSIHADATPKKGNFHNANGTTTYFFSQDTDKRAKNVTIRENKRVYKHAFKKAGYTTLRTFSKAKNQARKIESIKLGTDIQDHVIYNLRKKFKNVKDRGVHSAPLWVLVGAQMPAILIEVGYVTGNIDAKRLKQTNYRKIIAKGIAQGIQHYLKIREQYGF